jgi:TRAP-type C4-dicarboxylate transport system permease small subunit
VRRALDLLYGASALLAGVFMVLIAIFSLMQMGGRLLGFEAHSYDEFAGWSMAASSFLGLAYTFRRNEHIRVSLLLDRLRGSLRTGAEIVVLLLSAAMAVYFAWFTADMIKVSYQLNDMTQGLVAVPLWIPQSGMGLGVVILAIAVVDDLVVAAMGRKPSYLAAQANKAVSLTENV